jgi:hypothetical protein
VYRKVHGTIVHFDDNTTPCGPCDDQHIIACVYELGAILANCQVCVVIQFPPANI